MPKRQGQRPRVLTIVAPRSATTGSFAAYLDSLGVTAVARDILNLDDFPMTDGLVLFPDGFNEPSVLSFLSELRRGRPALPVLIVTSRTQTYLPAPRQAMTAVLPQPTFAWEILEVLRELCSGSERKEKK